MRLVLPGRRIAVVFSPMFWLMAALYGAAAGGGSLRLAILWGVVIGASVLWHELGHALAYLAFGRSSQITVHGFGGETRPYEGGALKTWQRFVVSAAGCAAGLALAGAAVALALFVRLRPIGPFRPEEYLPPILWANVYVSLLNLLPVQPLDGGHLSLLLLEARFGRAGVKAAHILGLLTAGAAGLLFYLNGQPFIALFAAFLAAGEFRAFRAAVDYNPQDEDPALRAEAVSAQEAFEKGDREGGAARLAALLATLKPGQLHAAVTRQLAHDYAAMGRRAEAYPLLKSLPPGKLALPNRMLLQALAHEAKDFEESIRLGQNNFQEHPDAETAALLASSCAALGDSRRALQWLGTAKRLGLNPRRIARGSEFDKIRNEPDFQEFLDDGGEER